MPHAKHKGESKPATLPPAQDHRSGTPSNLQKQIVPGGSEKNPSSSALLPGVMLQASRKILPGIFMKSSSPPQQGHPHRRGEYGSRQREPPA